MKRYRYIGITLGPIDRIAEYSKSTRSIWASSYIFSFLAKKIVEGLKSRGIKKFLKPVITNDMLKSSPIGRFPDQYVFEVDENSELTVQEVYKIAGGILDEIAGDIKKDDEDVKKIIKQVIKVYVVEKTYETQSDPVVEDFQTMFDAMECRDAYIMQGYENKFAEYFDRDKSILLEEVGQNTKRIFTSILECSAQISLVKANEYEKDDSKLKALKPYQKYIAFVAADGDHFGKTISCDSVNSGLLSDFNTKLNEEVQNYGGQVIFQGGDDVLFFAPIFSSQKSQGNDQKSESKSQDIFSLINEIDGLFHSKVLQNIGDKNFEPTPSFSYGVAIAYYKHPMAETRARALQLLHDCKENGRNAIKWEVMKHSGQTYGGMIKKNAPGTETEQLTQMLNIIKNSTSDVDNNFLHSITHWLIKHEAILTHILQQNDKGNLLNNYFDNSFDEPVHGEKENFISAIKSYLLIEGLEKPHEKLHALLRYVELLLNKS